MTLIVSPASRAAHLIAHRRPRHILTLVSPETILPYTSDAVAPARHLVLRFNDISVPSPGLHAPDSAVVTTLLGFGQDWDGRDPFLIHCWAGISRSTAAAYILICARAPAGREQSIATALRHASPTATPNPLMVRLADDILSRGGAMTKAIEKIGRGQEAAEGLPFDFPCG